MLAELAASFHRAVVILGAFYLTFAVMIAIILCSAIFFVVRMFVKFRQFRGPSQVLCPETGSIAIIRINALRAAVSGAVANPDLYVSECSLWPERQGCGQDCVCMISLAPFAADRLRS
jgi:hypothetical protein